MSSNPGFPHFSRRCRLALAVVRGRLRRQRRRQHHRRAAEARAVGETLTVGSDVPYPPFEEFGTNKTEFKGFDIELVEAIAEEDRPHA